MPLEYIIKEGGLDWCVRKAFREEGIHELILVGQNNFIFLAVRCSYSASVIKGKSQWKNIESRKIKGIKASWLKER